MENKAALPVSLLSLIRPDLKDFGGYSSAASESSGEVPPIKLDANESPWPPFGTLASLCDVHRYAEPQPVALRGRLASYWGVSPEEILLTCGSDQGIDVLLRLFCSAGKDSILVCPPTFAMYQVYAQLQGASVLSVPLLENGQLDVPTILKTATAQTKLLFIPAPNAPMGHAMREEDLLALCNALAGTSAVVVDEAYVEFSDKPEGFTASLNKIPNLIILRTLSKAHALAGERVGCVIAAREVIQALRCALPPYPLSQSAIRASMDALSPTGLAQSEGRRETLKAERAYLAAKLIAAEDVLRVYPSEGNFLFVETTGSEAFLARLRRFGIQGRNMDKQKKGAVRLAVGCPKENDLVLRALDISIERTSLSCRSASVQRATKETMIDVVVDLDRVCPSNIQTSLGFFDHMLDQVATHGGFFLTLHAEGDLNVDMHHTVEDCALALGEAIKKALGDKKGVARFSFTAPLDEAVAQVVLDLSGRPFVLFNASVSAAPCDGMGMDMVEHFFRSFATSLGATLHLNAKGDNQHHVIEACFKALGRALRQALAREGAALPSTKGVL